MHSVPCDSAITVARQFFSRSGLSRNVSREISHFFARHMRVIPYFSRSGLGQSCAGREICELIHLGDSDMGIGLFRTTVPGIQE
jgi:hypothetical protein